MFLALLPDFNAVDDILPQYVTAGTYRGYRIEIHISYPDAEGGIFLEQGLSGINLLTQAAANGTAYAELDEAEDKGGDSNKQ